MQHSVWDLQVHAEDLQRRRLREASDARQAIEAMRCGGVEPDGRQQGPWQVFARLLVWLTPGRFASPLTPKPAKIPAVNQTVGEQRSRQATTGRGGQPYADMAVLARDERGRNVEQPSRVGEC